MLTNLWHMLAFQTHRFTKPELGAVVVCSDRLQRHLRHAHYWPALDPPTPYQVPLDRLEEVVAADSPAAAVRLLTSGSL